MQRDPRNLIGLLTPPGAAAIAVVRLAGPDVAAFLQSHFSSVARLGHCVHGQLVDDGRIIDDPVIVLAGDGQIADINLHGGQWVIQECLELAKRSGFQLVDCLEELIDTDDLIEQEMLAALPFARTEQGLRMLLAQPRLWRDFNPTPDSARQMLADRSLWWMLNPPSVAIVGVPNAGKSTLANQLFGQQRSITADLPGTTRDWIGDWANLRGLPVLLLDTPGQRETQDSIEQAAIAGSRQQIERADLVILVLDPTQSLEPEQDDMLRRYPDALLVSNKSDLAEFGQRKQVDAICIVATTGQGLEQLTERICARFDYSVHEPPADRRPRWWTSRQEKLLFRAAQVETPLK